MVEVKEGWRKRKREENLDIQRKKLREILAKAVRAPFYRKKFEEAKIKPEDIKDTSDLRKIPITSKAEIPLTVQKNPPFGGILAVPREKIIRCYISPGPIPTALTKEDVESWADRTARILYLCGVRPRDIAINAVSYHMVPAGLMIHDGFEKLGCTVIPTGPGQSKTQAEILKQFKVTVIQGFTEFLLHIADVARKELGLDPKKDFNLRLSISVPLPPRPERNKIEEALGLRERATQVYGIGETGWVAAECNAEQGLHIVEDAFIAEVVDPETKEKVGPEERGELVLTCLDTEGTPKIRYGSGDSVTLSEEKCSCGLEEIRILQVLGRIDEITKVKGLFVFPSTIEAVIKEYPELRRFQAVVDRPKGIDRLTIKIEYLGAPEKIEEIKGKLLKDFKEALRIDTEVEFVKPEEIKPTDKRLVDLRKESIAWTKQ